MRVRRKRDRDRCGGGDDGGGGKRQMALFPKQSVSAKRMKPPRPETAPLFTMAPNGKHEKHLTGDFLSDIATAAEYSPKA
jgi:hypothetical protein